jgi:hypothetical protein
MPTTTTAAGTIPMTVIRDGYFDGQYWRAGDVISVPTEYATTLQHAGFAMVAAPAPPAASNGGHKKRN